MFLVGDQYLASLAECAWLRKSPTNSHTQR